MAARFRHDSFDSHVMVLAKDDATRFLESLHLVLQES